MSTNNKNNKRGLKEMFGNQNVMFRLCVLLLILSFVLAIFVWNINLRRKTHTDNESYRTLVHQAVKEAIQADALLETDPVQSLLGITSAQAKIATAAQLVGGMANLSFLSGGLNVANIANTMAYHERQNRTIATQRGLLKQTSLSQYAEERAVLDNSQRASAIPSS